MKSKRVALVMAFVLSCTSLLTLSGCNEASSSSEGYVREPDIYEMEETPSISSKLFDTALEGIGAGIKGGLTSVVTDIGMWAAHGIAKKMGFNFDTNRTYRDEVIERIDKVNVQLTELNKKVDWLINQQHNNEYLTSYKAFMTQYSALNVKVKDLWQGYCDIEDRIAEKDAKGNPVYTEEQIEPLIEKLCTYIRNNELAKSDIHIQAETFAQNFYGTESEVNALNIHSIVYIVERFVNMNTPYVETRKDEFEEILCDPYTVLFNACNLVELEYSYQMSKLNVTKYVLASDNNMITYTVKDGTTETTYWNCLPSKKAEYIAKYGAELKKLDKDATPDNYENKLLADYNKDLYNLDRFISASAKNYNDITKLIKEFKADRFNLAKKDERHLVYSKNDVQSSSLTMKSLIPNEFMEYDSEDRTFKINYSAFGNIKKAEFIKFANALEQGATETDEKGQVKYLTFAEFFKKSGYIFPANNKSKLLVLGADSDGYPNTSDWVNNGYKFENCFFVTCVDTSLKIHDFNEKPTFRNIGYCNYAEKVRDKNGCATSFKEEWYVGEIREHNESDKRYYMDNLTSSFESQWAHSPFMYLTIFNLSTKPLSGSVTSKSVSF